MEYICSNSVKIEVFMYAQWKFKNNWLSISVPITAQTSTNRNSVVKFI